MTKTLASRGRKDDYLSLVRRLPLKAIRTEADHTAALNVSGRLIGMARKLTAGESQYLDVLSLLIREYERVGGRAKLPRAGGTDVLKHLLAEHGMTQKELAHLLGVGESAASMILAGTRELTKSHIDRLSRHFGIGVGAFLG